jgi:hypothetical protein
MMMMMMMMIMNMMVMMIIMMKIIIIMIKETPLMSVEVHKNSTNQLDHLLILKL